MIILIQPVVYELPVKVQQILMSISGYLKQFNLKFKLSFAVSPCLRYLNLLTVNFLQPLSDFIILGS